MDVILAICSSRNDLLVFPPHSSIQSILSKHIYRTFKSRSWARAQPFEMQILSIKVVFPTFSNSQVGKALNWHWDLCCGGGGAGLVTKSSLTFVTPWTVAHHASLSMGFSRQEYCSGLPFAFPGDLPNPGIEPASPALQANSLPLSHWEDLYCCVTKYS